MISFNQALEKLQSSIALQESECIAVGSAVGRVVAHNVYSKSDSPRFSNCAVDGYAFHFEQGQRSYKVVGELAAGESYNGKLIRGECLRVFTGAQLPTGANTCVMQEYVQRSGSAITHTDNGLVVGGNVRLRGEELKEGDFILAKGTRINPAAVGLLSSCGIEKVQVYKRPKVHVLVTGSEFTSPSNPEEGKIFNSNGPMLVSALREKGFSCSFDQIDDNPEQLRTAIEEGLAKYDVLISTGGVSVGDHDYVRQTCEKIGLKTVFHKVAQKPGKPMYFAKAQGRFFFGLPGNPRAVMIGFLLHVLPFLNGLEGSNPQALSVKKMPLAAELNLKGSRTELLAVQIQNDMVRVSEGQNSHMLSSLVSAHGIAVIPENERQFNRGDFVQVVVI